MMRSSLLTNNDIGALIHERRIQAGEIQSMSFTEHDLPPIFAPNTPKYDIPIEGEYITRKLNKSQLKLALELKGLNSDGGVEQLRLRATQSVIPLTVTVGKMTE